MELTNENYHSVEEKKIYMGSTQFKSFLQCEKCALAKINGEIVKEKTTALLMGSYIDAHFSNEMDEFKHSNPEIFTKNGTLKSDYQKCEEIIKVIEEDEMMMKYLSGEHQVIMTGEISGVPFKIKIDSYHPDKAIVDQKIVKDFIPIWDEEERCKRNFVEYWGYLYQGALYQEIVRQNTGKKLPFVLAATTKEKVPQNALFRLDDEDLEKALETIKKMAPRFQGIKEGKIVPTECGKCDYCKSKAKVSGIKSYHILDPDYKKDEIEY